MKLSISRDDDLTPDQPSVDENIAVANEVLDDYGRELEGQYIHDNGYWEYLLWKYEQLGRPRSMKQKIFEFAAKWILKSIFGGGGNKMANEQLIDVGKVATQTLTVIMDQTTLDDVAYDKLADMVKEEIPGNYAEPVIGRILVGIGEELMKVEE